MPTIYKYCPRKLLRYFTEKVGERLRGQIFRVNALMVVMGILMGFMVGIGTYGHRYRHIPLIRFLFLAATTLFLPIVSYIVSSSDLDNYKSTTILIETTVVYCRARAHIMFVLIWTALVLNVGINTTALVAADAREGRSIPPNMTLLIQAMWTSYLGVYICIVSGPPPQMILFLLGPFGVIFAKLVLKCYAWYIATQSLAFGRNARLIVGYMEQLASEHMPPLIVTGEHTMQIQEKPCGYQLKSMSYRLRDDMYNKGLVTFDKVWQLNDTLLRSKSPQLKELCFSFALFKLLRCRIARFNIFWKYILAALVILAEVRDIAFYIRSNWIKVALICQYVKHGSWRQSATIQRCVGCVLRSKGKLIRNWEDKMGQSSVLVLHPSKTPMALLRHLIPLSGQNTKTPSAVKSAIVGALRKGYERGQINGDVPSFQRILHLQDDDEIIWTFGERARLPTHQPPSDTDHISAANHISQYCAYLVAHYPELLPEDDEWCKSLYKAVEKDAKRVLIGNDSMSEVEYRRRLIQLLSAERNHEVLKDGARLAEQLAEEGEEVAWKALAAFWSDMILYVAPSDNIDGHMEAIARGGELITLLWALVTHLGIVGRSDNTTDAATVDV
uniref:DUF4220 domain-containing protein n=1 Tax=Aegilops tauschii TaxID=37682 RepID=N1R1L7_AEGTA